MLLDIARATNRRQLADGQRFRLAEILKRKGWTPYRLAQVTGLTAPTAYRLADPKLQFGDLPEWLPDTKRRRG